MALAAGPYVGGLLIVDRSYTPLLWFGVIAVSACYACFLGAIRLGGAATLRALIYRVRHWQGLTPPDSGALLVNDITLRTITASRSAQAQSPGGSHTSTAGTL
jgi:hypothetical protein